MESDWNDEAEPAPRSPHRSTLRGAWVWAGVRIATGSLVLVALIGLRIIQATASDPPSDTSESAAPFEDAAERAAPDTGPDAERKEPTRVSGSAETAARAGGEGSSLLSRLSDSLPGGGTGAAEADRMVSCALADGTRFMTAADCALRGGRARVFEARE